MSFLGEIKRRKVFQVAAVYAVVAWLIIQIIGEISEPLSLPDWLDTVVIVLLAVGFPLAIILAWAFDLTPEGVVRDQGTNVSTQSSGRRIEYVLIGLLVLAVGWLVYRDIGRTEMPSEKIATIPPSVTEPVEQEEMREVLPNSVAILPFANHSPDPDNAYFAAGIHESTINQLTKIRDLRVIARTSVIQYENNPPPIPEIAEALNVEMVMEGSVRYSNDRVLITAQLIEGRTGTHLWSDEFNRELTDVFAVQLEIAEHIATAMQIQLLTDERASLEQPPTESAEAYQHFLYALSLPPVGTSPEYFPLVIESLKRAVAADPEFALAYNWLGTFYYNHGDLDLATDYKQKAVELDPIIANESVIPGLIQLNYFSRQEEGRASLIRIIENSPYSVPALVAARTLVTFSGDYYAEAQRLGARAIETDPNDSFVHHNVARINLRTGDLAAAARSAREEIRLSPDNHRSYLDLGLIEYLDENPIQAREQLDKAVNLMSSGAIFRVHEIAYLYGLLGDTKQATALLARLEQLNQDRQDENWRPLAWAVLGTRERERALREWTITVNGYIEENRPVRPDDIGNFKNNWLNDPLLEEPEFLELRRRLGFKG